MQSDALEFDGCCNRLFLHSDAPLQLTLLPVNRSDMKNLPEDTPPETVYICAQRVCFPPRIALC
jgi:hypothetical protein